MTQEKHKQRHIELHKSLDELCADFIDNTGRLPSKTLVGDLLKWSYQQTLNPATAKTRAVTALQNSDKLTKKQQTCRHPKAIHFEHMNGWYCKQCHAVYINGHYVIQQRTQ